MATTPETRRYRFGDFTICNTQQALWKNGKPVTIGTKPYHLLLALVENAGQVLTKEQLSEIAWPGQIVTDAAISKQILRLRKLIEDKDGGQPIIETHRGLGYRFSATVTEEMPAATEPLPPVTDMKQQRYYPLLLLTLLVLLATGLFLSRNEHDSNLPLSEPQRLNLAIISDATGSNWLASNGTDYLSEQLRRHPSIRTVNPNQLGYQGQSADQLAIQLVSTGSIDYSVLVRMQPQENGHYQATLKLRDKSRIIASTSLSATTLPALFNRTQKWIVGNLETHEALAGTPDGPARETDDYTLRSYLQGMHELQANGNSPRARDYFQAAVNQDPDFMPAWNKLAAVTLDLGMIDRAQAIARTQLLRVQPDDLLNRIAFQYTLAMAQYRLGQSGQSEETLGNLDESILHTDDPYVRLAALKLLTMKTILSGELQRALQYENQALEISRQHFSMPNHLANLYLQRGRTYFQSQQREKALADFKRAARTYARTDHANGMVASYCQLSRLSLLENRIDEVLHVFTQAQPWISRSNETHEQLCVLMAATVALNLRGLFQQANAAVEQLRKLEVSTGNAMYRYLAESLVSHGLYVQGRYLDGYRHLKTIEDSLLASSHSTSVQLAHAEVLPLLAARALPAEEAENLIDELLTRVPAVQQIPTGPAAIQRARAHVAARDGDSNAALELLAKAQTRYEKLKQFFISDYIGMERLEILLEQGETEAFSQLLVQLEPRIGYDYLLFKLKAAHAAAEGRLDQAVMLMEENRLKANELWTADDQLLLEQYRNQTARVARVTGTSPQQKKHSSMP